MTMSLPLDGEGRPLKRDRRYEEALREERLIIRLIFVALMVLPIEAFSMLRTPLYAVVIILGLLFFMVSSVLRGARHLDITMFALCGALFFYLFAQWIAGGFQGTERIFQAATFLVVLLCFSRYSWQKSDLRWLRYVCIILLIIWLALWFVMGRPTNYYTAWCLHSNGFAVLLYCFIAIGLISIALESRLGASEALTLSLSLLLLVFANSRSATIALLVTLFTAFVLRAPKKVSSLKRLSFILFGAMVIGALAFTVVYPSLLGTQLGYDLDSLSREYLHKNFFSGRQEVWRQVLVAIEGHEAFGLGLSMVPGMIYSTVFSSHNLYLQTILQSGFIGLALVVFLLWLVVERLSRGGGNVSRIGIAFVIGIMAHECFEVALTQNNFQVGLVCWAVMGITLSLSALRSNENRGCK